ncbi:hypothetical protein KOL99_12520 [Geomonas sp. Red51]|nr:hypothetical protein [Geomonas azotofigens]
MSDYLTDRMKKKEFDSTATLYCKFVLTAFSLYRLLPEDDKPRAKTSADVATIASLGRNLIEIFNLFYYLHLDKITGVEREFRLMCSIYHGHQEHHKVGVKMEIDSERLESNKLKLDKHQKAIFSHPFFQNLSKKQQNDMINGKSSTYINRVDITKNYTDNYKLIDALYKVMSNHVHTGVYGLSLTFDDSEYGCDNSRNRKYIANTLYLVNYYAGMMAYSILEQHPEWSDNVPDRDSKLIHQLLERF